MLLEHLITTFVWIFSGVLCSSHSSSIELNHDGSCAKLNSNSNYTGEQLLMENGKEIWDLGILRINSYLHSSYIPTWNNSVSSIWVKSECKITACEESSFRGICTTFSSSINNLEKEWNDRISSISCTCSTDCKRSQCTDIVFSESDCAKAYLEPGCNTCNGTFIELNSTTVEHIGSEFTSKIKALVVKPECTLMLYDYFDHQGQPTNIDGGVFEDWKSEVSSYKCICPAERSGILNDPSNSIPFRIKTSSIPAMINLPDSIHELHTLIGSEYPRHKGLLSALRSVRNRRSGKNAYIMLLGAIDSGKSLFVKSLLGVNSTTLTNSSYYETLTRKITEYRLPVRIEDLGIANAELRFVDIPEFSEAKNFAQNAELLVGIEKYLDDHQELRYTLPNIVLIFVKFDPRTKLLTQKGNFIKMFNSIDIFRGRIFDRRYANAIFVVTQPDYKPTMEDNLIIRLPIIRRNVEENILIPLPNIVIMEEGELEKRNFASLASKVKHLGLLAGDPIGEAIPRIFFSSLDTKNILISSQTVPDLERSKFSYYLQLLNPNSDNGHISDKNKNETEISQLLSEAHQYLDPNLRQTFPNTLQYLKKTLEFLNITTVRSVPRTKAGIVTMMKEVHQNPAVVTLLEKALHLKIPALNIHLLTGYSYNILSDTILQTTPFKIKSTQSSDIGYLIPTIMNLSVENEIKNIFEMFSSEAEYIKDKLTKLKFQQKLGSDFKFLGQPKPGVNIISTTLIPPSPSTLTLSALREHRRFKLVLKDNLEFNEEFKDNIRKLPTFNQSDWNSVEAWKYFFTKYGTHVVKAAHGGGAIEIFTKSFNPEQSSVFEKTVQMTQALFNLFQLFDSGRFVKNVEVPSYQLNFKGGDNKYHVFDMTGISPDAAAILLKDWEESLSLYPTMLENEIEILSLINIVDKLSSETAVDMRRAMKAFLSSSLVYIPPSPRSGPQTTLLPSTTPRTTNDDKTIETIVNAFTGQFNTIFNELKDERLRHANQTGTLLNTLQEDKSASNANVVNLLETMNKERTKYNQEISNLYETMKKESAVHFGHVTSLLYTITDERKKNMEQISYVFNAMGKERSENNAGLANLVEALTGETKKGNEHVTSLLQMLQQEQENNEKHRTSIINMIMNQRGSG